MHDMDATRPIEQELRDAYAAQGERYEQAEHTLARLKGAIEQNGAAAAELEELQTIMHEIRTIDARIADAWRRLTSGDDRIRRTLRPTLDRISETLARLQQQIRATEYEAAARLEQAASSLDRSCRGTDMVRAYGSQATK
jgi:HPt (histidine-containing phosphotransfer) domain-containing protein